MPLHEYRAVRVGEGLARILRSGYDGEDVALWARCKLRKPTTCVATETPLNVGDEAYRPVGNQMYRYERINAKVIDAMPLPEPSS